ncbi:MAG: hypothetical protein ACYC91_14265 [Solirubrobacteraceae bacterium]
MIALSGGHLFNGALLSFFFMTQYLQGVSGDTPLQAGLAFLPVTVLAAFAAAAATPRLLRRTSNPLLCAGCAAILSAPPGSAAPRSTPATSPGS